MNIVSHRETPGGGETVKADDRNPENGNASHRYEIFYGDGCSQHLSFQDGPINVVGANGITNEALLAIVADRLDGFQSSKWACEENAVALDAVKAALAALESRTAKRAARGVEGTHAV